MKKLLYSFSLLLALSIFISSCGKGMYITKRKYNKGFYVNHSPKKGQQKNTPTSTQTKNKNSEAVAVVVPPKSNNPAVSENKETAPVITAEAPKTEVGTTSQGSSKKTSSSVFKNKSSQIKLLQTIIPNKKMTRELEKKLAHDTSGALSLLWVVILVILLIYLIALLFDAFGLGWFIHILALIALILLILWLLRVV